jgi:leucyl-tRNA synthetase
LEARVLFLAPFTPHLCEEIWEALGKEGFVSTADWPVSDDSKVDLKALSGEELVASVREDTISILAATKLAPKKVVFYVAAPWKWRIYLDALMTARDGVLQVSRLMRLTMGDAELRKDAKRVSSFVQELVEDLAKAPKELVDGRLSAGRSDEFQIISEARIFLAKELKADVYVYHEDDESRYDPRSRARLAEPYRPAIYVE